MSPLPIDLIQLFETFLNPTLRKIQHNSSNISSSKSDVTYNFNSCNQAKELLKVIGSHFVKKWRHSENVHYRDMVITEQKLSFLFAIYLYSPSFSNVFYNCTTFWKLTNPCVYYIEIISTSSDIKQTGSA